MKDRELLLLGFYGSYQRALGLIPLLLHWHVLSSRGVAVGNGFRIVVLERLASPRELHPDPSTQKVRNPNFNKIPYLL